MADLLFLVADLLFLVADLLLVVDLLFSGALVSINCKAFLTPDAFLLSTNCKASLTAEADLPSTNCKIALAAEIVRPSTSFNAFLIAEGVLTSPNSAAAFLMTESLSLEAERCRLVLVSEGDLTLSADFDLTLSCAFSVPNSALAREGEILLVFSIDINLDFLRYLQIAFSLPF